jgi:hypothetical protein
VGVGGAAFPCGQKTRFGKLAENYYFKLKNWVSGLKNFKIIDPNKRKFNK